MSHDPDCKTAQMSQNLLVSAAQLSDKAETIAECSDQTTLDSLSPKTTRKEQLPLVFFSK